MASGDLLEKFGPLGSFGPPTNYATLDTRNTRPVLDFDAATDEARYWHFVMPPFYSGGSVAVKIHMRATSATSNDAYFQSAFEKMTGLDIDSDSFDSAQSGHGTANATSGIDTIITITHTSSQIDGMVAGDEGRLSINRDADNASDNMTGDAEITLVELYEV